MLALLGFGLRALIPIGFEPADGSLSLVLCHEGFPAYFFSGERGAVARGGHAGGGARDAHCLFCNAATPVPACFPASIARIAPISIGIVTFIESPAQSVRSAHIPQARAPPRLV